MRNPVLNVPLRYLVPILLGVFVLGIQAFLYNTNQTRAFANVRADAVEDVRNQLNRAQGMIELLHKDASLLQIRTLVSSFGAETGHEVMILTDEEEKVIASTHMKLLDKAADLPQTPSDIAAIETIKVSGGVEVFLSHEGRKVNGYATVCGMSQAGHLRLNNCGYLYLRNDISPALNNISGALTQAALQDGFGVLVLGLILWAVIHFSLTRRAQGLISTANQFSAGNPNARAHLNGRDELAVVGKAVDAMLDQIVNDRAALETSEERLRKVFESVADGIITFDRDCIVKDFNAASEIIFAQTRLKIVGQPLSNLIAPSHREKRLNQSLNEGVIETVGMRPDGSEFDMEMSLSNMPINNEVQTIAIVRDVTERKRLESLKSEFISIVSHELRTPITSIQGALGLIIGGVTGKVPNDVYQMIDMCKRNSDRLLNLINDLLDMDKIASGEIEFNFASHSAADILLEASEINQPYAEAHDVAFKINAETSSNVWADTDRIHQVLSNLLSNAAKFSQPGDTIMLSATDVGEHVRFAITDNGPGIPENYRNKIFERFTQVENANTRKVDGTGLGLSISQSIVKHHHGTIGVDTEIGHGSTFWFDLPICSDVELPTQANKAAS